jgi:alpha-N-arabinofuranosidase
MAATIARWKFFTFALALVLQGCGQGVSTSANSLNQSVRSSNDDGPPNGSPSASSSAPADVFLQLDATASGPMVNRLVLGSNVQWVDGGDDLLMRGTNRFDGAMENLVQSLGPTILRYPGGDQSDLYDWTHGMGPLSARGANPRMVTHQLQTTYMGSAELMELAEKVGAATIFTVNVLSGNANEAAEWVKQMNVSGLKNASGHMLPKVVYWEIGNEPYLPNSDGSNPRSCEIDPHTYVARINAFAQAMRAVDPSIQIGVALANDVQNGIQFTSPGCKLFTATVLKGLTQPIDFISLHDAYLPYDFGKDHSASDMYWAAMGSTQSIQADFAAMRSQLSSYAALQRLPFAVTEYNALFNPSPGSAYIHSTASPMGALYVADALRFFASRDDVLMANIWSLSGNDHWGMIHTPTNPAGAYGRPTYEVFRLFGEALQGERISPKVQSPTFNAPRLGLNGAASNLPVVTTLVTKVNSSAGSQTWRIIMINKDYAIVHIAKISFSNGGAGAESAHLSLLTAANLIEDDDLPNVMQRSEKDLVPGPDISVTLPAHSIALATIQISSNSN